eukprot:6178146-Pleurochrysis_carterae.AAC.4
MGSELARGNGQTLGTGQARTAHPYRRSGLHYNIKRSLAPCEPARDGGASERASERASATFSLPAIPFSHVADRRGRVVREERDGGRVEGRGGQEPRPVVGGGLHRVHTPYCPGGFVRHVRLAPPSAQSRHTKHFRGGQWGRGPMASSLLASGTSPISQRGAPSQPTADDRLAGGESSLISACALHA